MAAAELAVAVTLLASFFMELWNGRKCQSALWTDSPVGQVIQDNRVTHV